MEFRKAQRTGIYLRLAISGPAGAGKTMTALRVATSLAPGGVAVIDSEHDTALRYAPKPWQRPPYPVGVFEFDHLSLGDSHHPDRYREALQLAAKHGYQVVVVDSLSHAWAGKEGALELVDRAAKRSQSGNSFTAWRDITPLHNRLVEAMLSFPGHLIVTLRSKMAYILEEDSRGKRTPRKVGMEPIMREGIEYEFDVVGEMTLDHQMLVNKTRCSALSGQVLDRPGEELAGVLRDWMDGGKTSQTPEAPPVPTAQPDSSLLRHPRSSLVSEATRQRIQAALTPAELDAVEMELEAKGRELGRPVPAAAIELIKERRDQLLAASQAPGAGDDSADI